MPKMRYILYLKAPHHKMINIDCNAWKDKFENFDKSKTTSIIFVYEDKDGNLHSLQQSGA
jgi:hypothetical protein